VKSRLSLLCVLFCLAIAITGVRPGMAQLLEPQDPQWVTEMVQQGWQKLQEGVLQRSVGGQVETFTYGAEGLQWTMESLKRQIYTLQLVYDRQPSPELAESIEILENQLGVAAARLSGGQVEEPSNAQMENCDFSMGAHAYAERLLGALSPGVTARADAYFHSSGCGFIGNTYANVTVEGNSGSVFTYKNQEDPKYGSPWLDSAAQLSLSGVTTACKSTAYARAWSDYPSFGYEANRIENYDCRPDVPVLTVAISGSDHVFTNSNSPCANVTWTATPSGGTPGYAYNWYVNGTYQGSGSQLTKQYCYDNTLNVSVQSFDSGNPQQTAWGYFTTTISYFDPCASNPYTCLCNPNYCGGGGCYDPRFEYQRICVEPIYD
jgi:hypothetical protein